MNAIHPSPTATVSPYQPMITDGYADPGRFQLAQIWSTIKKRKWVLLGAIGAALLAAVLITLLTTPLYTAHATLDIQREQHNFTNVDNEERESASAEYDQEFYQTQYGLLKSRSLAEAIVTSLGLENDVNFFQLFDVKPAANWFSGKLVRADAPPRDQRVKLAADIIAGRLVVVPDRNSRLVELSFSSPDPAFSKRVVDGWTAQFVQLSLDRRFQATSYARTYLEQRLQQLRDRIDTSQRQLVEYSAQQGIINVPTSSSSDNGNDSASVGSGRDVPLVATDLAALNSELARATAARIVAESRIHSGNVTPEALDNSTITTLRTRRAELSADYAKLLQQYEPEFPAVQAVRSQISALDRDITREESRVGSSLQDTYTSSITRERDLQQRVNGLKASMLDLRRRSIQYDILQRDVDTSRQLYAALLQRYKEIGVAGGVGVNNIAVVDPAELPQSPSSPRLMVNFAIATLVGLIIGGGLAFLLEQLDFGISDPAEVTTSLRLPLLGTVPKLQDDAAEAALEDPKSALSEAYFSIQATMSFLTDHGFPRTVVVTSSRPAEGKSTSSYALARTLAQVGRRVILVDGDMRSPSVETLTNTSGTFGLSNFLVGQVGPDKVDTLIQHGPGGLPVMTAGVQPPSTTELLSSERLSQLLSVLETKYDNIIIDAPPVMGLADTLLLSANAEGVLFVIEAHHTNKGAARVAIGRILSAKASIFGVVLTKFDARQAKFGHEFDYGYGYGYGYGRGSSTKE